MSIPISKVVEYTLHVSDGLHNISEYRGDSDYYRISKRFEQMADKIDKYNSTSIREDIKDFIVLLKQLAKDKTLTAYQISTITYLEKRYSELLK